MAQDGERLPPGIYRHGDGYRGKVYVGKDPKTGHSLYARTRTYATVKEALRERSRLLHQVETRTWAPPAHETVGAYLRRWIDEHRHALRGTTWKSYERNVRIHIAPAFDHVRLDRLTAAHLNRFYAEKLRSGRLDHWGKPTGEPLDAATVHYFHRILHKALEDAVKEGVLPHNPASRATPPKVERKEMRALEPEEAVKFLEANRTSRLYPFWLTAILTGLRLGELLGLKWGDVDLEAGTLRVERQLIRSSPTPQFGPPKSDHSRRTQAIPSVLVEALKALRVEQELERAFYGADYSDYGLVFCQPNGRPYHADTITRWHLKRSLKKAGLPPMRTHDLRHTFAKLSIGADIDPKELQRRLGHSSIQVTFDIYGHVLKSRDREAAERLQALLFEKPDVGRGQSAASPDERHGRPGSP